jgi:hypothetical protein
MCPHFANSLTYLGLPEALGVLDRGIEVAPEVDDREVRHPLLAVLEDPGLRQVHRPFLSNWEF